MSGIDPALKAVRRFAFLLLATYDMWSLRSTCGVPAAIWSPRSHSSHSP